MTAADVLDRGRESFERQAWADAYAQLSAADQESPLEPEDLERLATAAYLVGRDADSIDIWARAHHELVRRGDVERAARCAFWLSFILLNKGELVRGGGWVARARRLLDDGQRDCVEQGYLLWGVAARSIFEGDSTSACATFARAVEIGERFGDRDLVTLARVGQSRALLWLGETAAGVALLDEVMVAVEAGEVSAIVAGDVYCSVIEGCPGPLDRGRPPGLGLQRPGHRPGPGTSQTPCIPSIGNHVAELGGEPFRDRVRAQRMIKQANKRAARLLDGPGA